MIDWILNIYIYPQQRLYIRLVARVELDSIIKSLKSRFQAMDIPKKIVQSYVATLHQPGYATKAKITLP